MRYLTPASVVLILLTCVALLLALTGSSDAVIERRSRPVFVNLTSGAADVQKATMAIMLADNAMKAGHHVTVFLNVHGVELVDRNNRIPMYNRRTMFQGALETMIENGLDVVVCPYSLGLAGLTKEDIIEGVALLEDNGTFPPIQESSAVFSY